MTLTTGSMFSGCGGLDLGFENAGFNIVWQCEKDKWCNKILSRHWPNLTIHDDANELYHAQKVDVLIGGFPCQTVSAAGRKEGVDDPRWLWPTFNRAISYIRPKYVVVENVQGLLSRGLGEVLGSLAGQGYDAEWFCLRSSDVGAPHRRKRVFILASNTSSQGFGTDGGETLGEQEKAWREKDDNITDGLSESKLQAAAFADSISGRLKKRQSGWKLQFIEQDNHPASDSNGQHEYGSWGTGKTRWEEFTDGYFGRYQGAIDRWSNILGPPPNPKDEKGRVSCEFVEWMMGYPPHWTEGVSRTQRLKMLGNSVQVQCAELVGNVLMEKVRNE